MCTGAESNFEDRVLGEVKIIVLLLCQAKGGGASRLMVLKKQFVSTWGNLVSSIARVKLLIRLGCVQGLHSFTLVSGNLLN